MLRSAATVSSVRLNIDGFCYNGARSYFEEKIMNAVLNPNGGLFTDYKVADISLAEWGRKEIAIA